MGGAMVSGLCCVCLASAISSPLLDEVSIAGATSVLINITGNTELTMYEINEASSLIQEEAHEDVNVIWGWVVDESMTDDVRVTVIATGFQENLHAKLPSAERRVAQQAPQCREQLVARSGCAELVDLLGECSKRRQFRCSPYRGGRHVCCTVRQNLSLEELKKRSEW